MCLSFLCVRFLLLPPVPILIQTAASEAVYLHFDLYCHVEMEKEGDRSGAAGSSSEEDGEEMEEEVEALTSASPDKKVEELIYTLLQWCDPLLCSVGVPAWV